jgi:hypothetical protein
VRYLLIILLLATNFTHWMLPVSAQSTHPCAGLRSRIQWTDGSSNPVTLIDPSTITYEIVSRGQIRQVLWDANTGCILVSSSIGLWAYPAEDLQTPPLPLKLSHSAVGRSTIINLLPDGTILGHATSLAYSTDGNLSARLVDAGSYVSSLQLLNRATGEVLAESQPDAHLKAPLQFTDDDQTILSIGDGTVSGWALDEQGLHEMFYVGQQRPLRNVYELWV